MMQQLFEQALGIDSPWFINDLTFDSVAKRLDISIDFERGSKFSYKEDGVTLTNLPVHDTVKKTWRHLNFFEHECYLTARVPRIKTESNKVRLIKTPWEGECPGFTLLFEVMLLQLCREMPVNAVALFSKVDDNKLWRLLNLYVVKARELEDFSNVSKVGVDETSKKKNHDYISLFVDLEKRKTLFITEGKDSSTVDDFVQDLKAHGGAAENITDVSCDMSPAFIKGVKEKLPKSKITFDKFHIIKLLKDAVGKVRRAESIENNLLKGTKIIFDKNRGNMTEKQLVYLQEKLELKSLRLKTVRAFHLCEAFQEIYKSETEQEFEQKLKSWYSWAIRSRLVPMKDVAKTIKKHWGGIIRWYQSRINNGILEGLNSLIQSAKSKARGFKTFKNFKTISYLLTADLDITKVNKLYKPIRQN